MKRGRNRQILFSSLPVRPPFLAVFLNTSAGHEIPLMYSMTGLCHDSFEGIRIRMLAAVSFILFYGFLLGTSFWNWKRILDFWAAGQTSLIVSIESSFMQHRSGFPPYWNSMTSFQKHRGDVKFCLLYAYEPIASTKFNFNKFFMPIILLFRVCHACISLVLVPTVFFLCLIHLVLSAK